MRLRLVNIRVSPMVGAWARWHFGEALRFPSSSNEACLLRYHLRRPPKDYVSPEAVSYSLDVVSVAVPELRDKPWREWCYLSERRGCKAIRQSLRALMLAQLWLDMLRYLLDGGIEVALEQWCKDNGVSRWEWSVKKEYYAMRKRYETCARPIRLMRRG